jgi:glycosyltransferase involved in cell wall biosynthesis
VAAISEYLGAWVRRVASVRPVVIPLGVSPVDGAPGAAPGESRLLYVGEISDRKGIADLLQGLAGTDPSVTLDLVGRGDLERFRSLARTIGVGPRARFLGLVPDETLAASYRSCLAVCSASRWEGFGLPVLEGFAYGRPAIVRDQGGMREQIEQSGGGACFSDPSEIPGCVERVRSHWDAFSRAGTEFARRHPWSSTFDRYAALFRAVLAR